VTPPPVPPNRYRIRPESENLLCPKCGAGPYFKKGSLVLHGLREHPEIGRRGRYDLVTQARAAKRDGILAASTWAMIARDRRERGDA
jgi:hypothetical protein